MCITSTARRSSLTLQVLPSHLLTTSTEQHDQSPASKAAIATAAAIASVRAEADARQSPELQPSLALPLPKLAGSGGGGKKPKKGGAAVHHLPHHDGLVVQHHYHDHATDPVVDPSLIKHKAKGGVITPFPVKLHDMLDRIEADGLAHVVSWQPHGRCFVVHKPKEFVNHVMPHYFKQTKMASFQRQLNLYGFNRLTGGLDKGGYYHEMFLRGKVSLAYDIHRMRVKGTGVRLPTNPDNEPNFYALPPITRDPVPAAFAPPPSSSPGAVPPMPALPKPVAAAGRVDMAQRRAELLRESHDHTRKIAKARQQRDQSRSAKQQQLQSQQQRANPENDVVFFEGLPFHYLDPSALPSRPADAKMAAPVFEPKCPPAAPELAMMKQAPAPKLRRTASVVSESESSDDDSSSGVRVDGESALLPSFSPANMDWDGPLSCPSLQAHMRRSSFQSFAQEGFAALAEPARPIEEDIERFFQGFDMPVDLYHEQIERMGDDDDTAFGYLLEQAITE